jgi:hypothetical protein
MKRALLYIIVSLLGGSGCYQAQNNGVLRRYAYEAERNKDWYGATQYYGRLYTADSLNLRVQYAFAEACRLSYDMSTALYLYNKTAAVDNGKRYPLTFYWIGQILKSRQQYKEAKKWFTKFYKLKLRKEKYQYYKTKAKLEIEACDLAQILMSNPSLPEPEQLETVINSYQSEYGAFERDSALYFSSIRPPEKKYKSYEDNNKDQELPVYSKIYRSEIRNQKFRKIKAMDTLINSKVYHSANTCFNKDQTEMILSRCINKNASEYTCELYISQLGKKKWQQARRMEEPVNQASVTTTQPHLSEMNGREVLFFASDRPGGEGGLDIWYAFRNADGTFEKPINAGKKINTPDDEVTPWFVAGENTLYFSSTWHKGLGGMDVFRSDFVNQEFSEPHNLGVPVNSSHNDLYYSESPDGRRIYLSSNRKGSLFEYKQNCCNDIYRFHVRPDSVPMEVVPADSLLLLKEQLKLLVPLTLYFHNDEPDPKRLDTVTQKNYEATFLDYKAMQPLYLTEYARNLKGTERDIARNKIENFFADSVEAGLDDLNRFAGMLEKVLKEGETVEITLKGYCSPLASSQYNINLAKRRISSLVVFFRQYKEGLFNTYIGNADGAGGRIIFKYVDVGELPASKVSDNLKDKRNSVYSPYAASERKIQIIAISYGK